MKKKIISVHGSYFCDNYGDLLLIDIFCKWIRELYPEATINFPLAKSDANVELPENTTRGVRNLLKSDCLIYIGGGYFGERPTHRIKWSLRNYYRHIIIGKIARLFCIPIAIIGVEFGPLSISFFRRAVIRLANKSRVVVCRNHESLSFLQEHGVKKAKESADAVLALSDIYMPEQHDERQVLYHMPDELENMERIKSFVYSLCAEMKRNGLYRIVLVEDGPHKEGYYNDFFELFETKEIKYRYIPYKNTDDLINQINNSHYVITNKLHVGITGLALNKLVFCLYSHPKAVRLHQQVGNEKFCVSINENDIVFKERLRSFFDTNNYTLPLKIKQKALYNKIELNCFLDKYTS